MLLFSPLTVRERKLSPDSLKCGFGKLRMFTVDLKGMQFLFFFPFFSHSLLYLLPDPLVVRLPGAAQPPLQCSRHDDNQEE